jgi:hypothetical protein
MDSPGIPRVRGNILRVPDANPGLLFVNGQQKPFSSANVVWRSPVPMAVNMIVEVEFDAMGNIAALTAAADTQNYSGQNVGQPGGVPQHAGNQAAGTAQPGQAFDKIAARFGGKVALGALAALLLAWFVLPVVSVSVVIVSKGFTFWDITGFDFNNPLSFMGGASSIGLWGLLGLIAVFSPVVAPFLKNPKAKLANLLPLVFIAATCLKIWWDVSSAAAEVNKSAGNSIFGGPPVSPMKEMMDALSLGVGAYVLVAAALVLAAMAFTSRPQQSH